MTGGSVGIIGGGLTGIVAAYRLSQQGFDVTLFEASDDLGGLAGGFALAGLHVEKAYHFLYRTDSHILSLADELGLSDALTFHPSSVSTYYGGKLYPMMTPIDLLRFRPLPFLDRLRAGISVLYLQRLKDWRTLSGVSALSWLRKWAGRSVTDVIWEPLLRGKFDRHFDKVAMSWLWGRIKQRVDSRDRESGGETLGYFDGGFKVLIDRLVARAAEAGADFRKSAPVTGISYDEARGKVVVRQAADARLFDRVLVTTPSGVTAKLLSGCQSDDPAYFEKLASVEYLSAVVHVFASRQKISNYYWHNINIKNAPFVVFLSLTNLVGPERFGNLNIYYIGDYVPPDHPYVTDDPEAVKERWYDSLKSLFPDFDRSAVVDDAIFRMRNAQHIVDVGYESQKLVSHGTPCPNVFMCNFSQIYPMDRGTNYAVRDGERMARLISRSFVSAERDLEAVELTI